MNALIEYLPVLIPVFFIQLTLALIAAVHIVRHKKFKFGSIAIWPGIVLFIQIIGPILYFTIGKADE